MLASYESEMWVRKGYFIFCAWLYFGVSTCIIVYFKLPMVSISVEFQELRNLPSQPSPTVSSMPLQLSEERTMDREGGGLC